jgi:hypothetical protein
MTTKIAKRIGSSDRVLRIRSIDHATRIAKTYIYNDAYLLMNEDRMATIVYQLLGWVVDTNVIHELNKIKEVVTHKTLECWR